MDNEIIGILVIVGVVILIFLALREVVCWYNKINERVDLQKEQNLILKKVLSELKDVSESLQKNKVQENQDFQDDNDFEEIVEI